MHIGKAGKHLTRSQDREEQRTWLYFVTRQITYDAESGHANALISAIFQLRLLHLAEILSS